MVAPLTRATASPSELRSLLMSMDTAAAPSSRRDTADPGDLMRLLQDAGRDRRSTASPSDLKDFLAGGGLVDGEIAQDNAPRFTVSSGSTAGRTLARRTTASPSQLLELFSKE